MIDLIPATGIIGAIILVVGAAWPVKIFKSPIASTKNWLFIFGNALMFAYALMNYLQAEGVFFFILLQVLVNMGGWLAVIELPRAVENAIVGLLGLAMIVWSLFIFDDNQTIFFIVGLTILALGFSFDAGKNKQLALTVGSGLIAYFSYLVADQIFLWLNVFFALFSAYYFVKLRKAT